MPESPRIEELRRRVQMDPASIAFAALAEEYRRAGRLEEAVATCEAGLLRHPAYLSARVTLGRALIELGRYDEARAQLEQVLRVAPENLAAIRALAEIHGRASDYTADHVGEAAPQPTAEAVPAQAEPPRDAPSVESPPVHASSDMTETTPPVVVAPSAPSPIRLAAWVTQAPKPAPPALAALERFLNAILRARDELGSGHAVR